MTAAIRKTSTAANGGSDVGTTFLDLLDTEIEALWKCVRVYCPTVGGTANAITLTSDTGLVTSILALARPMGIRWKATATNTTAVTVAVDGLTPVNLKYKTGSALAAGAVVNGTEYDADFDGTSLLLLNPTTTATVPSPGYVAEEQQASTVAGGGFTSGAWQTRLLNTEVYDTLGIAALSSNTFTLPAGTYRATYWAMGNKCNGHQVRLFDVTAVAVIANSYGSSEVCGVGDGTITKSTGEVTFTIATAHAIRLEHRCETTRATDGFGDPNGFGNVEVYSHISIWRH